MNKLKKMFKDESGFTLIEMALVLFVISILLLLIIPSIGDTQDTVQDTGNEAIVRVVETQMELYKLNKGVSEVTAQELEAAGYITDTQLENYADLKPE